MNNLNLTKQQTYVSDFLYNVYLKSDSKELDKWLEYLARENGDEQLAKALSGNGFDLLEYHFKEGNE